MPTHRVQAAAEGMPISRRSFLSGAAAGTIAAATFPIVANAAESEVEKLTALVSRHRAADVAVHKGDAHYLFVEQAFNDGLATDPVTYMTSAGRLTLHKERLSPTKDGGLVPSAILAARRSRTLAEPFTEEEAEAYLENTRAIYAADIEAYEAACTAYEKRWEASGCVEAEETADSLQDIEVNIWEELRAFVCTSKASSRAKADYVLGSQNLVDRLRMDVMDGAPVGLAEFVLSLCGTDQEQAL